jgi:hypothetical protein
VIQPEQLIPNTNPVAHLIFTHYPFLDPRPLRRLGKTDIAFLEQRGCFRLPSPLEIEEFFKEYFLHVHPILPILDEARFWAIFTFKHQKDTESTRLSLFILQAVMFLSCSVSMKIQTSQGSMKTKNNSSSPRLCFRSSDFQAYGLHVCNFIQQQRLKKLTLLHFHRSIQVGLHHV